MVTIVKLSISFKGGGDKKIASQKLEWKGQSKVGSIDNIKHKPGGGNIKVRLLIASHETNGMRNYFIEQH